MMAPHLAPISSSCQDGPSSTSGILRLERIDEPVELLEPGIGIMLAVLGVTGNLNGTST